MLKLLKQENFEKAQCKGGSLNTRAGKRLRLKCSG